MQMTRRQVLLSPHRPKTTTSATDWPLMGQRTGQWTHHEGLGVASVAADHPHFGRVDVHPVQRSLVGRQLAEQNLQRRGDKQEFASTEPNQEIRKGRHQRFKIVSVADVQNYRNRAQWQLAAPRNHTGKCESKQAGSLRYRWRIAPIRQNDSIESFSDVFGVDLYLLGPPGELDLVVEVLLVAAEEVGRDRVTQRACAYDRRPSTGRMHQKLSNSRRLSSITDSDNDATERQTPRAEVRQPGRHCLEHANKDRVRGLTLVGDLDLHVRGVGVATLRHRDLELGLEDRQGPCSTRHTERIS